MGKKKILIVEDDADIAKTIQYMLEQEGYDVEAVDNGMDGLSRIKCEAPDLIILDLKIPRLPGEEVCREIRKDDRISNVPIIMLTAKATDVDRIVGRVIGADYYMTKPFDIDELLAKIASLIGARQDSSEYGEAADPTMWGQS